MKFEVFAKYENYSQILDFYIFSLNEDGSRSICTSLDKGTFDKSDNCMPVKPTFSITSGMSKPFLQAMANELDNLGIRAEGEPILENELTAVKGHLDDMRRIAFNELDIDDG